MAARRKKAVAIDAMAPRHYRHVNEDGHGVLLVTHLLIENAALQVTIRGTHTSTITCPTHADVEYLASVLMTGKVRVPINDAAVAFEAALAKKKLALTKEAP